jgi:hypothetical protein
MTTAERNPNEQDPEVEDLDVDDEDASAVKGGSASDPCMGGE